MPTNKKESVFEKEARERREARENARLRAEMAKKIGGDSTVIEVERRKVDSLAGEGSTADKLKKDRQDKERKMKKIKKESGK